LLQKFLIFKNSYFGVGLEGGNIRHYYKENSWTRTYLLLPEK